LNLDKGLNMKHYKTPTEIRAIEEGQEFLIQEDWILLTDVEFQAIINPPKSEDEQLEEIKAHFKSLYLNEVNKVLATHDYDSLATVKLWADDATFGVEATSILNWYKAVINYNYTLLNAGTVPTDAEYLAGMPKYE